MKVNGITLEVKSSTLWDGGFYRFQQIRQQNYEILLCLGISPDAAYAWVARKTDIPWDKMDNQHAGKKGTDTWWISFSPPCSPFDWMTPKNGDLKEMCRELRKMTSDGGG